ncbi:MAG: sigma-70 family RNA polymerase sigma factor [Myxococcota bacterium]
MMTSAAESTWYPRVRPVEDFTQLLADACAGDERAYDRVLPVVYDELRALAQSMMRQERADHTLQATALVHEAYLKLVDQSRVQWDNRAHFFALAAQAIRRILVDHARAKRRDKRGGGAPKLELPAELAASYDDQVDVVAVDAALQELSERNARQAKIVELRFFGGLTVAEVADVTGASRRTVEREWRFARAWLFHALTDEG